MNASFSCECISSEAAAAPCRSNIVRNRLANYRSVRLVLFFALCAAPLALGSVEPWAWPVLTLLALAALVAWGAASLRQGGARIHGSLLYGLGASFLALGCFQWLAGRTADPVATRNALILLATDLILFFLAGQLFAGAPAKVFRQFGAVVTIYAAALGLLAIFQKLTGGGLIYGLVKPHAGAVFGPYINRNDYAGLMEMLIPVAAAWALTRRPGDRWRLLSFFAVVIAAGSLLVCGSRGGMVALLAELAIFAVVSWRVKPIARWRHLAIAGALVAAVALSAWTRPGRLRTKIESVTAFPLAPEVTLGQRLVVARDTLRMAWDHPWLGVGLGGFMAAFPLYQSFADSRVWEHAHNDYVEALAETGLVGGALLVAGLWIFLGKTFGNLGRRLAGSAGWIGIACGLGCCGLLVHSLVDFNLHIPANAAWFAVCLGVATVPTPEGRNPAGFPLESRGN